MPQPQFYHPDMQFDMQGHVDFNQTEELNSMLNILGLQLAEGQQDQLGDQGGDACSREIVLLDNGQLKVCFKDSEGSFFSNQQTYGEGLSKVVVDQFGKYIAVISIKCRSVMKTA